MKRVNLIYYFFFFNDTATTEIYTLSLHDALPISRIDQIFFHEDHPFQRREVAEALWALAQRNTLELLEGIPGNRKDRKSTRLNSSHANISYAVFCLKKKK